MPGRTREILRYDEGRSAAWAEGDCSWQAVFLRWKPGRTALHLAENHTPEVCMTAAGHKLNVIAEQKWFEIGAPIAQPARPSGKGGAELSAVGNRRADAPNTLRLPFACYEVTDAARPYFVFYCLWDDRANAQGFKTAGLTYGNRLAPVLAGLRNPGQRSIEIAVTGPENATAAEAALRAELAQLIKPE
jgi:hypothetical protein